MSSADLLASPSWHRVTRSFLGEAPRMSDVTEAQWRLLQPLLANDGRKSGRPRKNPRPILNGILYVLTHKCAWRKMPPRYGNYVTCWRYLLHWRNDGKWKQVQQVLGRTSHPLFKQ